METFILYSSPTCPKCEQLKKLMIEKNLSFVVCTDETYMIERGFKGIPTLEVEGTDETFGFMEAINYVREF